MNRIAVTVVGLIVATVAAAPYALADAKQLPEPYVMDWTAPATTDQHGPDSIQHRIEDFAKDYDSFFVSVFYNLESEIGSPCMVAELNKNAFVAEQDNIVFKGQFDMTACLRDEFAEGAISGALLDVYVNVSCEGVDLSAVDGVAFEAGMKALRSLCQETVVATDHIQSILTSKSVHKIEIGEATYVSENTSKSTMEFSAIDGARCRSQRQESGAYMFDGCLKRERDDSQTSWRQEVNGEVTTGNDSSVNFEVKKYLPGSIWQFQGTGADVHGVLVEGQIEFQRDNWSGIVTAEGLEKPLLYQARGTYEGAELEQSGAVERSSVE